MACKKQQRQSRQDKGQGKPFKKSVIASLDELPDIARDVERFGVRVNINVIDCGPRRRETIHVMFDHESDGRLLDYWPGTGTIKLQDRFYRNMCSTLTDASRYALGFIRPPTDDEEKATRKKKRRHKSWRRKATKHKATAT